MDVFSQRLKRQARALGLSDAEVARRSGLNERRYGHYVSGTREPNLETLVRICGVLGLTPNDLLGFGPDEGEATERSHLIDRIIAGANVLDEDDLAVAVSQIEALIRHRSNQ